MKRPVIVERINPDKGHSLPEPFAETLGAYEGRDIGAQFELSQFGAHAETIFPGSQSALRHWHSHSDELVYVLNGELTLVCDDEEYALSAGMAWLSMSSTVMRTLNRCKKVLPVGSCTPS